MLCNSCEKKAFCSGLCPEAELYAGQDHKTRREHFTFPAPSYSPHQDPPPADPIKLSKTEAKILMLQKKGFTRAEVRFVLDLSASALRVHLFHLRAKINAFSDLSD